MSPYFHHAHLLFAADCSAYACPSFHDQLSKGKVPVLCCPASDFDIATKLGNIFSYNEIASVTVVKLDKSCCRDLRGYILEEVKMSHLPIPIQVTNLFVDAEDVTEQRRVCIPLGGFPPSGSSDTISHVAYRMQKII